MYTKVWNENLRFFTGKIRITSVNQFQAYHWFNILFFFVFVRFYEQNNKNTVYVQQEKTN